MKLKSLLHSSSAPSRSSIAVLCGLALHLLTPRATLAQTGTVKSPEEIVVRTAYARLSFGTEIATIRQLAMSNTPQSEVAPTLEKQVVRFEIKNLKTGDIEEILNDNYSNLVTMPDGAEYLETGTAGQRSLMNNEERVEGGSTARWVTGIKPNFDVSMPLHQVLQMTNIHGVIRYVQVTLQTSLDGHTHLYKALWLFDSNPKAPLIIDPNSGAGLQTISSRSVYPHLLLETSLRNHSVVSDWIAAHITTNASCIANQQSECCDLDILQCGIHPDDVRESLVHPLRPKTVVPPPSIDRS